MFGPDNNFWFTEADGGRIGRITPAGAITEFSTGIPSGSRPNGIAAGPAADGSLWFTLSSGNQIGRITTAGAVTVSTLPNTGSSPTSIALGPDNNLWFTENPGNKIGRITTVSVVTEFSLPTASRAFGISAGSDGNGVGSAPLSESVGRGVPMAITVNEPALLTEKVVLAALMMSGAPGVPALLPKKGSKVRSQLFIMDLVKREGKWLVNGWVPRSSPPVPNGSSNNGAGQ